MGLRKINHVIMEMVGYIYRLYSAKYIFLSKIINFEVINLLLLLGADKAC